MESASTEQHTEADDTRAERYLRTVYPYATRHNLTVQDAAELPLTKKRLQMVTWARMYCSEDTDQREHALKSVNAFEQLPSSDEEDEEVETALNKPVEVSDGAAPLLGACSPKRGIEEMWPPSAVAKIARLEGDLAHLKAQIATMGRRTASALATVSSLEADNQTLQRQNSELSMGHSPRPQNDMLTPRFGTEVDPTGGGSKPMMIMEDAQRLCDAMVAKSKVGKGARKLMAKYLRLHNTGNPGARDARQKRSPWEAFLRNEYDIDMHAIRRDVEMAKNLWALCIHPGTCSVEGAGTSYDPLGTSCKVAETSRKCGTEMPYHWSDQDAKQEALKSANSTSITPTAQDATLMPPPSVAATALTVSATVADRLIGASLHSGLALAGAPGTPSDMEGLNSPPAISGDLPTGFPDGRAFAVPPSRKGA